jgi:hypothetical protein
MGDDGTENVVVNNLEDYWKKSRQNVIIED